MENGKPSVPPMKDNSNTEQNKKTGPKKYLKFIIPAIVLIIAIAAVVSVLLVKSKKKGEPIVVTDENGVPYTDEAGTPVTVVPETVCVPLTDVLGEKVTDEDGKVVTTVYYKEVKIKVPVTDKAGKPVKDEKGNTVYTEKYVSVPYESESKSADKNVSTTVIPITDVKGNTGVDASGEVLTTVVEITEAPTTPNIEPASTNWKFTQGGTAADYVSDIIKTNDDCYISANITNSKDGDFGKFKNEAVVAPFTVLTKTDNNGNTVWEKAVGTAKGTFQIMAVTPAENGEFYAAGYGKNVEGVKGYGYYDAFVAKYSKSCELQWIKKFGTTTVDYFNDVIITSDGGVVAVGSVGTNNKDASGSGGKNLESRAVIVKYSPDGDLLWKTFEGGNQDYFNSVSEGKDGNLYVVGNFYSNVLFNNLGNSDSAVLKFSKDGKYKDVCQIGGTNIENFKSIITASDGNLVITGYSKSADGDEVKNSFFKNDYAARGNYDAYIIKISPELKVVCGSAFRGQNDDKLENIIETESGFVATGYTNSSTRDLKGVTTRGGTDIVLAGFNKNCELLWASSFGGTNNDQASAICKGADGGYVVAGKTCSDDVDLKGISSYTDKENSVGVIVKFPE